MRRGRPPYSELLTPREQEVLALLREGLTNEQIATRLGISESGARYHVSQILSKLGVGSRQEAAAWRAGRPAVAPIWNHLRVFVHGLSRPAGIAIVGMAVGVLVALAFGVGLMSSREGGAASQGIQPPPQVEDLIQLADEATALASAEIPDAQLYLVALATHTGIYTFRFSESGSSRDVGVQGPNRDLSLPEWQVNVIARPASAGTPAALDLARLSHVPREAADVVAEKWNSSPDNSGVSLEMKGGALIWSVRATKVSYTMKCELPDVDLTKVTCEPPRKLQPPPGFSPVP